MPLIKFKFIQKGLIFFHQVVYPSCLPTHQKCVQKSWCLQVHVKIPNTCNNVCQAFSSTCSAEHTLVFSVHTLFRRQSFSDLGLCMFQVIFLEIFNAFYMLFYFFLHLNSCNNESFYTSGLGLSLFMDTYILVRCLEFSWVLYAAHLFSTLDSLNVNKQPILHIF